MNDLPIKPARGRGGAPPKINKEDLLARYGPAAVNLVTLLYRLAKEGEFSAVDAAQAWANAQPEEARQQKILSLFGEIDRRRLSETMKMDKGPIPRGLVQAFYDLWAPRRSQHHILAIADELKQLCVIVQAAAEHNAIEGKPSGAKSKALTRANEVAHLKDKLLRVQEDLILTQKNEVRFRDLSDFLMITLMRLQGTHQNLLRERDNLLARAEAAEAVAAVVRDAETAHDQLARAERQLEQVRGKATEAEWLVRQLQDRHLVLVTRLLELEDVEDVAPPPAGLVRAASNGFPGEQSVAQHEEVLDRVDDLLAEGDHDLVLTRHRLEQDVPFVVDLDTGSDDVVVPAGTTTDNSVTSQNASFGSDNGSHDRSAGSLVPLPKEPRRSWRDRVKVLTGGLFDFSEKLPPARRRELIDVITRPVSRPHHIAVLSVKGGVGKTTVTACLGATLASLRTDRVIAIDVDPDRGTLAMKCPRETTATIRHLLRDSGRLMSYRDVRAYTSQDASRLEILASEQDPSISEALTDVDYLGAVAVLEHFYSIVLTDCGTGMTHSAMRGVLDTADTLVLVASASIDGAQSSAATIDWLEAHGHRDLVAKSVTVINSARVGSGRIDMDKLAAHFSQRCRAVVRFPYDEHLADGAEVDLRAVSQDTRNALLTLAATITEDFAPPVEAPYFSSNPAVPRQSIGNATWGSAPVSDLEATIPNLAWTGWRSPVPELVTTPEPPASAEDRAPSFSPESTYDEIRTDLVEGRIVADEYLARWKEIGQFVRTSSPVLPRDQALWQAEAARVDSKIDQAAYEARRAWILRNTAMFPPTA